MWRVFLPLLRAGSPPPPPGPEVFSRFQSGPPGETSSQAGRTLGLLVELRLLHLAVRALGLADAGASAGRMAIADGDAVLVMRYALPRWRVDSIADDKNVCIPEAEKNLSVTDQELTDLFISSGIELCHDKPDEAITGFVRSKSACFPSSRGALALEQENETFRSAAHYMNYFPESAAELALYSDTAEETGMVLFPAPETHCPLPDNRAEPGDVVDLEAERLCRMTPGEARRHRQAVMLGRIENDYVLKLLGIF